MWREARALSAALVLASCAGSSAATRPEAPGAAQAEVAAEQAAAAWAQLDPERALSEAERAARLGARGSSLEVGARAALALGLSARGRALLEQTQDPTLLRLRARLAIANGELGAAAADLRQSSRLSREEDPWTAAVLPALEAAREDVYAVSGPETVTLDLVAGPLPIVEVQIDTTRSLALIGSGVGLAVLDPSVRASAGAIDELALGALRVRSVPHTVRSLADVRAALGMDIGMVLGADLLLRLHATLDGPGRRLVLHGQPPAREDTTSAPLLTLSGSFLAIRASVEGRPGWLTLDSAGLFPIALTEPGVDALGLGDRTWSPLTEADAAPRLSVITARLGALEIEDVPAIRGVLPNEHASAVGAPVVGALGWSVLEQLTVSFDARARRLRFEP